MNKSKKIFFILGLLLLVILNTACVFPDKLPVLKKLKSYSPEKVEYGKTTLKSFKRSFKIPDSDIEIYTDGITIVKLKPSVIDTYNLVRVGFKDNKLDWIEFNLKHKIDISKFTSFYGRPVNIETKYNKDYDYYNYDFFNIAANKAKKFATAVTFFASATSKEITSNQAKTDIPFNKKKKFFEKFSNVEPGVTTENDFTSENPELIPYMDDRQETTSFYVMTDELGEAGYYYDKAVLKFESGLLAWVNLIPKNLPVTECIKAINKPYKKENVDSVYELYDFSGFVIVADKKTKLVKSIGLFNRDIKL